LLFELICSEAMQVLNSLYSNLLPRSEFRFALLLHKILLGSLVHKILLGSLVHKILLPTPLKSNDSERFRSHPQNEVLTQKYSVIVILNVIRIYSF
jgi:hypothetical protein